MTIQEAAQRIEALLNEMGAEGIAVEAAIRSLTLTKGETYSDAETVSPVDNTNTVWEIDK